MNDDADPEVNEEDSQEFENKLSHLFGEKKLMAEINRRLQKNNFDKRDNKKSFLRFGWIF